jgi:GDPmannose 4,6-dehydratase
MIASYRERYGLHASSGITYNHESPRRPPEFVTRKVTRAAAAIKLGLQDRLELGSLDATRDWGFAGDYVEAMWRMLQRDAPADYVIATGVSRSVRELVEATFGCVGLDPDEYLHVDESLVRPKDPVALVGDASKAKSELGWVPETKFETMIEAMVEADLEYWDTVQRLRPGAAPANPPL